ncbi:Putative peptidase S1, PA clan [Septoria linicola]|uniref:Peptidase S1, PA clan n=1 Tax=Septoria linicola TaxID=215465 RepID=A0A9Q9AL08_9PEZI|nr:putative peptidase S1, PA clan [Septoria linicola]USW48908.1 Putative peptidase S1, PA clan [Septoria linicola]
MLNKALRRLPKADIQALRFKQDKLRQPTSQIPSFIRSSQSSSPSIAEAASATLLFVWSGSSTAFCISQSGLILTCAHCIAESANEYDPKVERWLLFSNGDPVRAKPLVWDAQRDLALLQITVAPAHLEDTPFPYIRLAAEPPKLRTSLLCIGNPGAENLETDQEGVATNFDILHISEGRFRGLDKSQDVQDNSEIGALKHDCWTYWGHSGAPLLDAKNGSLLGCHSSWDDETGMRRGVAWEAIRAFLTQHCEEQPPSGSVDDPVIL